MRSFRDYRSMTNRPIQRNWLYGLLALLWCLGVGFGARRLLLADQAYGGRYALVAAYTAGAGAIAAGIIAFLAPRRPYTTGAVIGMLAPLAAALAVFWAEYDPTWWPVAIGAALATGILGAFVGIAFRWLLRRDDAYPSLLRR